MVIDELILRKGTTRYPIDSYDNKMIDEIVVEGQKFHFAKQKDLTGTSEIVAYNGVDEPIISLGVSGATSQVLLPTEYQQVEYIESTGTQYIDTGIKGASNVKLQFKGAFARVSGYSYLTGSRNGGFDVGNPNMLCVFANTDNFDCQYHKTSYKIYDTTTTKVTIEISKDGVFFNNTLQYSVSQEDWSNNYNITIFAVNTAGTISYGKNHKMYSYKLYVDNILVRDFIPCYRKSDNVIGMYDLVSGTLYTNSGTGTFKKGANAPTPEAPVPIENANDNGMSVILRGENLFNAQGEIAFGGASRFKYGNNYITNESVTPSAADRVVFLKTYPAGTYTISAKGEYAGDGFTYRFLCTAKSNGGTYNSYYKSYYFDWLNTTSPQTSFTFTTTEDFQIGFAMSGTPTYLRGTIYDIMLTPTSQAVKYKPYVEETIAIPTSIDVNGTSVPLLFSEYDKLSVDRVNNKVIYLEGSFMYSYTGNEKGACMQIVTGNGLNYQSFLETAAGGSFTPCVKNVGYCSHFKKAGWNPLSAYGTYATRIVDVIFRTDGVQTLDEFKAFLKEQYENGTPVTIVKQRQKAREHDITNTDLGQSLLALATRKGTNYLEISSNLAPSQTDLSYWRQIIPNE